MKPARIRVGKISVRLRGVTAREAEQRAASIAREVARALAADQRLAGRRTTNIDRLELRLPPHEKRSR